MNPDGYSPEVKWFDGRKIEGVLEEFKLTAKSSRRSPESFWHWFMQVKAYLLGLNHNRIDSNDHRFARIFVLFKSGDYRDEAIEAYCWWMEFTALELDDNWRVMKSWMEEQ
jgi:hypothetical protein